MLIPPRAITGVVLCGGEGRRVGGADKPLLPLEGKPLVAHVLDRLTPQVGQLVISANRSLNDYRHFGHLVIADDMPGCGPLGGLASVAPHVNTSWLFCCPGDAPLLDRTLVARLAGTLTATDLAVYPHDSARAQYLFLLVRTESCRGLPAYLAGGGRSVHGWLETVGARGVPMPELAESFANVNDSAALVRLSTGN